MARAHLAISIAQASNFLVICNLGVPMKMASTGAVAVAAALLFLLPAAPAQAQLRTWVSGVGDDANPCSRTAPCKTFPGAISKTAAGGEISVLNPGGFGVVTITKSISIVADGGEGSILAGAVSPPSGSTGIIVNAASTDTVILSGLIIDGGVNGLNGIRILSAKSVHIRNCVIRNFNGNPGAAIDIAPTAADVTVFVSNCTIEDNNKGIVVTPTGVGVNANVFVDRVRISKLAVGAAPLGRGLTANANSVIRVSRSSITNTTTAFKTAGNGEIISFQNNAVAGNTNGEVPTSTTPLK
jgi:hypothetical protein